MTKRRVTICSDRIKHPNTGLYTFCKELIKSISASSKDSETDIFYLEEKYGESLTSLNIKTLSTWQKILITMGRGEYVAHMMWQMEKWTPLRKGNNKIVLTIHDLNYQYEKSAKKVARYNKAIQRKVDMADYIVTISEFAKSDILRCLDVGDKPIDVIYNGCTFFEGKQTDNPIYKPKANFLFSIGTILRKKNFHVLPPLLCNNDLELIIAGTPSSYSTTILDEAKKWGVADRVKLIGAVSEADKDWYYRNCKGFVFPSVAEGFGLPVIEAMAYGKPTFISKHTSLPEIGKDYCYYFDYLFDPKSMQNQLIDGFYDFESRDINKQIRYAKSYSWDNAASQYCKIYDKLFVLKDNVG